MLILISPAKTLDFEPTTLDLPATKPALHTQANKLAKIAQGLSQKEVGKLMSVGDKLAKTAHGYFAAWKAKWDAAGAKQAVLAFRGDVYQGLDADTLTPKQLERAQNHLRVLSGLYGVLRPLDLIQPYRLEMGRALANDRGKDLYAWWGDRVTKQLNTDLAAATPRGTEPLVVNLASNEYWSVVNEKKLDAQIVTPVFKDMNKGKYKVLSFFAKRARGMMARHLIATRTKGTKAIESFDAAGYRFNKEMSSDESPVFLREASRES